MRRAEAAGAGGSRPALRALVLFALGGLASLFAGCGAEPAIVVRVRGIPTSAALLRALVHVDRVAAEPLSLPLGRHAGQSTLSFGLRLPETAVTRALAVGVAAFDDLDCIVAVGSLDEEPPLVRAGVNGEQQAHVELKPLEPADCGSGEPRLLRVSPSRLSTAGSDPAGRPQRLQVFGWGLAPDVRLSIRGQVATELEWRSGVEIGARLPALPGALGAVSIGVEQAGVHSAQRADLLSVFAGQVDFAVPRALGDSMSARMSASAGDFNQDGHLDLALLYRQWKWVLLGDGRGGFPSQAEGFDSALTSPSGLVAADLNQDKQLDLIATGEKPCVLLGRGNGRFAPCIPVSAPGGALFAQAADFNGDHVMDLVTANSYGATFLQGDGSGKFSRPIDLVNSHGLVYLALGDFNRDERSDLLIVDRSARKIHIFRGVPDGPPRALPEPLLLREGPLNATFADLDGDRWPDLAVGHAEGVSLLHGDGTGEFRLSGEVAMPGDTIYALQMLPLAAKAGPVRLLVTYTSQAQTSHKTWLQDASGSFRLSQEFPLGEGAARQQAVLGDFNEDRIVDLVAGGPSRYILHSGREDGTFFTAPSLPLASSACCVEAGDLDGDGKQDVVVARGDELDLLRGDGRGEFVLQPSFVKLGPAALTAVAKAKLDGDAADDVLIAAGTSLSLLLSRSLAKPAVTYDIGFPIVALSAYDLDGDRHMDVVVAGDGAVRILRGSANGVFTASPLLPGLIGAKALAAGDVNGDGRADLVLMNDSSISVFLKTGRSEAGYLQDLPYPPYGGCQGMVLADLTGDAILDVALARAEGSFDVLTLLRGTQGGRFSPGTDAYVGSVPGALLSADVNGDGRLDLLSSGNGVTQVLLNTGDGGFSAALLLGAGGETGKVAIGDFNSDRRPDLVSLADQSLQVILNTSR